jgi:CheY-like chemotaxis protein
MRGARGGYWGARQAMRDEVSLHGRKVLVVEDEALIAWSLETSLRRAHCQVVGPAFDLEGALELAEGREIEVALLDINLVGVQTFAVADALAARNIPFVFLTGYGDDILPERFHDRPVCRKPCSPEQALAALRSALVS